MSYYVITEGRNNMTLFLVDRTLTKKRWWTYTIDLAMAFNKLSAAQYSADRLRYKSPEVIDRDTAKKISADQMDRAIMEEEHPFSSEALGQE